MQAVSCSKKAVRDFVDNQGQEKAHEMIWSGIRNFPDASHDIGV